MQLRLEDSLLQGVLVDHRDVGEIIFAIEKLSEQFRNGKVRLIRLSKYSKLQDIDSPVWYTIEKSGTLHNRTIVSSAKVFTSHYVGRCTIDNVDISIVPRFFKGFVFRRILSLACNAFIPEGSTSTAFGKDGSIWLLGLLWKAFVEKALTLGQIPKQYIGIHDNLRRFRGRLDIPRHIHANLTDASKFFCTYRKLSMDNTINRAIRVTYRLLCDNGLSGVMGDLAGYDKKLEAFGVSDSNVTARDLDGIAYSALNDIYKPAMNISRIILDRKGAGAESKGVQVSPAFFLDIAELWELYLLRVLQKNLEPDFSVYSPNAEGGSFLVDGSLRSVRPDILIEKNGVILMIIDAKYKHYEKLGSTANDGNAVSREDLYQMCTYLYHYGTPGKTITGVFTSPFCDAMETHPLSSNDAHRIGIVNLGVNGITDLSEMQSAEKKFIQNIRSLLKS